MRAAFFIFLLQLFSAALIVRGEEVAAAAYEGFARDRGMLRETYRLSDEVPIQASSAEACGAAARLFSKVSFVGMSRARVLAMLGDPRSISDYGIAEAAGPDAPLKYRFDTGFGGSEYTLEFRAGVVIHFKVEGVD